MIFQIVVNEQTTGNKENEAIFGLFVKNPALSLRKC